MDSMPSSLRNALFKKYVDDETKCLLDHLCVIIVAHSDSEQSKRFRSCVVKVAVKIAWSYKQKQISKDQFIYLRSSFRKVCSSLVNTFRLKGIRDVDEQTLTRLSSHFSVFEERILEIFAEQFSQDIREEVSLSFQYIGSPFFLDFAFKDENTEEFKQVVFACSYYLSIMRNG
eukprot:TRINITY_DN9618_c0_g1_i1.p1 TRINITY_DN9618_c0_g1~~TRINITY_DN9618_c0_g1_i1.p1  ORF type:complete len:173 (-),score=32.05 TRINITY_DN9618_c0_g1_i1:65-583(-)